MGTGDAGRGTAFDKCDAYDFDVPQKPDALAKLQEMADRVRPPSEKKKDTNPKDAIGVRKPRCYAAMSAHVTRLVSLGMMEGAMKYGRHNYRAATVRASVYYDATMEHMHSWWEGQDTDPDSGLPHVIKAICSLYVLADAIISENIVDDRPPIALDIDALKKKYQPLVDDLFKRYPDPVPAYTEIGVKTAKEK